MMDSTSDTYIFIRPCGTQCLPLFFPSAKALGYYQMSLRDKNITSKVLSQYLCDSGLTQI